MSKKLKRILIIFALLFVVLVAAVQIIPRVIDTSTLKVALEKGINESTGIRFAIKELKIEPTLFHGLNVHLNTTTLRDMKNTPLGDVQNVTVTIRYLPFFTRRTPEIAKIHVNGVYLPVKETSILKALKLKLKEPDRSGFIKPAELKDAEILLTNFMVEDFEVPAHTRLLLPKTRRFQVRGEEFAIKHLMSDKPVSLIGNGNMSFLTSGGKAIEDQQTHNRLDMGNFDVFIEIPQESLKAGKMSPVMLGRLEMKMRGDELAFYAKYGKTGKTTGEGELKTQKDLPLQQGEALYHQLSDTFSIAIPPALKDVYLAGNMRLDNRFRLSGLDDSAKVPDVTLLGRSTLLDVSMGNFGNRRNPPVRAIKGEVNFHENRIEFPDLRALVGGIPLYLSGKYFQKDEVIDATLRGENIRLSEVKRALREFNVRNAQVEQADAAGIVDVNMRVTGKQTNPAYRGTIAVREGRFASPQLGLDLRRFNANVGLNGRLNLASKNFQIPAYNGYVNIFDARYKDPETGIPVRDVAGRITLGKIFHIQNFRARVGSELVHLNGTIDNTFKNYRFHVTGNNINLPRFRNEVLAKLPQLQGVVEQLQPYSGTANVNIVAMPNMRLYGRVDVNTFAMRSGPEYPISIPRLSLLFNNHQITVAQTTINMGDVALNLGGFFNTQSRAYKFNVASNEILLSFLRDNSDIIMMLSGIEIPQIWNTTGGLALNGTLSNTSSNVNVAFHNAGLSWKGGDFPLYDLNGSVIYKQAKGGKPVIASDDLSFRYGNSPVAVRANYQDRLTFRTDGVFSPLLGNHFLTKSNASGTPYREIPFHAAAAGVVGLGGGAKAPQNDVIADLFLDLTRFFSRNRPEGPQDAVAVKRDDVGGKPQDGADDRKGRADADDERVSQPRDENDERKADDERVSRSRNNDEDERVSRSRDEDGARKKNDRGDARDERNEKRRTDTRDEVAEKPDEATPLRLTTNPEAQAAQPSEIAQTPSLPVTGRAVTDADMQRPREIAIPTERQDIAAIRAGESHQQAQSAIEQLRRSEPTAPQLREGQPGQQANPPHIAVNPLPPMPAGLESEPLDLSDDKAFLDVQARYVKDALQVPQVLLHLFDGGNMVAEAVVDKLTDPAAMSYQAHVYSAPGISLDRLDGETASDFFENADGTVATDLTLRGSGFGLESVDGWLEASALEIPYLTIREFTANIGLAGKTATIEIPAVKIPGIAANLTATTDDIAATPITLQNVKIGGSQFNIESVTEFNENVFTPIISQQLMQPYLGNGPKAPGAPTLPIQFKRADLAFDEVIFQNIILANFTSQFSVYPNSFFELENTSTEAAGGKATGYLSMNPSDNNFLTLDLKSEDIKANALTRALLNVTGQIYGDVNGTIKFTTSGRTPEETMANANGTVSLKVTNGRLPTIAKVETLLTAANVVRGGVLGLNLNNIFRTLSVANTNYFAEMSGDFLVAEKVLYTENLVSDGEDLDLFIQGSIQMDDGSADLLVNGLMSQDVSGKLGVLGKLSVGSVLSYVPIIGNLGNKRGGLVGMIPGVGYVPGLGGPAGDTNRFQVRIKGSMDDPSAIQNFHWVKSRNL